MRFTWPSWAPSCRVTWPPTSMPSRWVLGFKRGTAGARTEENGAGGEGCCVHPQLVLWPAHHRLQTVGAILPAGLRVAGFRQWVLSSLQEVVLESGTPKRLTVAQSDPHCSTLKLPTPFPSTPAVQPLLAGGGGAV